jgi:hypothetical protein
MTFRKRNSGPSPWRAAHGRARELGRLIASECPALDELPAGSPTATVRVDRSPDGKFAPGNGLARLGKIQPGPRGVLMVLEAQADPAWQAARRWGRRAGRRRIQDWARLHGGELGSVPCGLIVEASVQQADAAYLEAKAAATNDTDLLKLASQLRQAARGALRDAWHLATLESAGRPQESHRDRLDREILEMKAKGEIP